ncbi:MAG: hypothetical protein HWD58_04010 [Bacteroidota bacterium]|nr:MAG: hypothetical protein HWD58_04010 [Bacteroidota bacterium]
MHIKLKDRSLQIESIELYLKECLPEATFSYLKRNIVIDNRPPEQRPSAYLVVETPEGGRSKVFVYTGDIHIKNWPRVQGFLGVLKAIFGKMKTDNAVNLGEKLIRLYNQSMGVNCIG